MDETLLGEILAAMERSEAILSQIAETRTDTTTASQEGNLDVLLASFFGAALGEQITRVESTTPPEAKTASDSLDKLTDKVNDTTKALDDLKDAIPETAGLPGGPGGPTPAVGTPTSPVTEPIAIDDTQGPVPVQVVNQPITPVAVPVPTPIPVVAPPTPPPTPAPIVPPVVPTTAAATPPVPPRGPVVPPPGSPLSPPVPPNPPIPPAGGGGGGPVPPTVPPRTTGGGGSPPTPPPVPPITTIAPFRLLNDELKKVTASISEMGDTLKKTLGSSAALFATAAASLGGLSRAASPALFSTLTQSFTLLSATLGQALVGPILRVSFALQDAARWVSGLDSGIKSTIGTWATWGTVTLGAVAAVGKIGGIVAGVLPILGNLKTALVLSVASPFGPLVAGLAALAAFKGAELFNAGGLAAVGKAFSDLAGKVIDAVASIATPLLAILGPALESLIPKLVMIGEIFVSAFSGAVSVISGIVGWFRSLDEATGGFVGKMLVAGVVFAATFGILRLGIVVIGSLVAGIFGYIGAMATATIATFTMSGATGVLTSAMRALSIAFATNPIGLIATVAAAAVAGVMALAGAFGSVGKEVERASERLRDMETLLEKLESGGHATKKELDTALGAEGAKALANAKTAEDRRKVLEDAAAKAEKQAKEQPLIAANKIAANVKAALLEETTSKTGMGRAGERATKVEKALIESGYSPEAAKKKSQEFFDKNVGIWGFGGSLGGKTVGDDVIKDILKDFKGPATDFEATAKTIRDALKTGVGIDVSGKGGMPKTPAEERLQELQGIRSKYAIAYQVDMQPQQMAAESVRKTVQNVGLGRDPLQQEILNMQRIVAQQLMPQVLKELQEANKKKIVKPLPIKPE